MDRSVSVVGLQPRTSATADSVKQSIASTLIVSGIALLAFDDLRVGGNSEIASLLTSPSWVLFLAGAAMTTPRRALPSIRALSLLIIFGLILSAITLMMLPAVVRGEYLPLKAAKVVVQLIIFAMCVRAGVIVACTRPHLLLSGGALLLALDIGTALIGTPITSTLDSSALLHATPNYNWRIRGGHFEASALGASMLLGTSFILMCTRRIWTVAAISVASFAVILASTQSRGTLTVILLTCALLAFVIMASGLRGVIRTGRVVAASVVAMSLLLTFALPVVTTSEGWSDLARAGSDATRSIWAISSWQSLIAYPLGQGYAGPLQWGSDIFTAVAQSYSSTYASQDLAEAYMLTNSGSDQAFAPKTLPALLAWYLGFPGLIVWGIFLFKSSRNLAMALPQSVGIFMALVILTSTASGYFASISAWGQALAIGAIWGLATTIRREKAI